MVVARPVHLLVAVVMLTVLLANVAKEAAAHLAPLRVVLLMHSVPLIAALTTLVSHVSSHPNVHPILTAPLANVANEAAVCLANNHCHVVIRVIILLILSA